MIRLILFGIVFYYLFKFLSKIFGVFLVKKVQQQYSNQQNYSQNNHRTEGDIKVSYTPKDDKKHVKGGDYVDFEEVD